MGRVVLFGSHPEFGYNLLMDQWDVPARMLANAAFWQASHLATPRGTERKAVQGTPYSIPLGAGLQRVADRLEGITATVNQLKQRSTKQAGWLSNELAMSTFGLSGTEIWQRNLDAFGEIAVALKQTIEQASATVREAANLEQSFRSQGNGTIAWADALHDALLGLEEAIHFRTPPEWNQDFGYEGVLQMLDRTESMLRKADANFDKSFEPSANPYQYFDTSPFQLAVGSYLAAIGVFGNAWMLLEVHRLRLEELILRVCNLQPVE
jgi:hypothetical protein